MKNKIYIKNVILFSFILFLLHQVLSFYYKYFHLGSFSTGNTLLFSIYWFTAVFSYIGVIYFALKKTIFESKELKLGKLIITSLAIVFIVYHLNFLAGYIQYYYIDEKDKIVTHNSVDQLKNLLNGEDNSAPSYEPFNTFIKYPYLTLIDRLSGFNIIRIFFFLISDSIVMPILLSLALYKWYQKHPEKIKMTNKIIDKLAWIELKDQSILSTRSYGKDKYYIPGGKREMDETDEQALIREIKEELNVTIDSTTLHYIGTFEAQAHGHAEGITVRMTCYSGKYSGDLKASSEIEEVKWLNYSDKDKISEVDKLIFDYLHRENLLD